MRVGVLIFGVGLAAAGLGCAGRPAAVGAPAPATGVEAPNRTAVHWVRDAAEHDALVVQTYRWAGERVRTMASGRAAGTWAVVLDADETVLDNSTYQKERLPEGGAFTDASWNAWVRRKEATAIPGAAAFIALVRQQGGRVAIVTNRDAGVCPETQANLMDLGILVDLVLCRMPGPSDKNPRFEAVRNGTAAPGVPALEILMWVGDNIQDFPALSQDIRTAGEAAYIEFGSRFIVLPNPMYGSWERNPWR